MQHVNAAILGHGEFESYRQRVMAIYDSWCRTHESLLRDIDISTLPKAVIGSLSEDLLARFADLPLLERYDVYQRLMDYWDEVMQDDVYLIAMGGWMEAAKPRGIIKDKERKIRETPDFTINRKKYKMDLIPPSLIVARYFLEDQAAIGTLQLKQETAARELEEFVEEHAGEDGLLEDSVNDSGQITRVGVRNRLKVIPDDNEPDGGEERRALTRCLKLIEGRG